MLFRSPKKEYDNSSGVGGIGFTGLAVSDFVAEILVFDRVEHADISKKVVTSKNLIFIKYLSSFYLL